MCPLHVAAFLGHPEVATSLLRHGGKVDAATKNGMTALYLATLANKTEMVKLLLQSGATVDVETVVSHLLFVIIIFFIALWYSVYLGT